jgi:hypothetical protein
MFDVGAVLCIGIGLAMAFSSDPKDIYAALWFFGIAAVLAIGRAGYWLVTDDSLPLPNTLLAAILFGSVGSLWITAHSWAHGKLPTVTKNASNQLRGQFLQTIVGQTLDQNVAIGFVEMTITNEGAGKSTVKPDSWSLTVTTAGVSHSGELVMIVAGTKMQMAGSGTIYTIGPSDAIYEKTSVAIDSGSIAHGWIEAVFRGLKPSDLVSTGAKWEINFEDHTGTKYTASYEYKGGERQPGPTYYPGGGVKPAAPTVPQSETKSPQGASPVKSESLEDRALQFVIEKIGEPLRPDSAPFHPRLLLRAPSMAASFTSFGKPKPMSNPQN